MKLRGSAMTIISQFTNAVVEVGGSSRSDISALESVFNQLLLGKDQTDSANLLHYFSLAMAAMAPIVVGGGWRGFDQSQLTKDQSYIESVLRKVVSANGDLGAADFLSTKNFLLGLVPAKLLSTDTGLEVLLDMVSD
jgi:hypothetical protein